MDAGRPKSGREEGFIIVGKNRVYGNLVDEQTRCKHYHSAVDILAIKFACCDTYYPCFECHETCADHPAKGWPKTKHSEKALLCGACGFEQPIAAYLDHPASCPACGSDFNPKCELHHHLYFEL